MTRHFFLGIYLIFFCTASFSSSNEFINLRQKYEQLVEEIKAKEKAADYDGDDEIVRERAKLPPKLPPFDVWVKTQQQDQNVITPVEKTLEPDQYQKKSIESQADIPSEKQTPKNDAIASQQLNTPSSSSISFNAKDFFILIFLIALGYGTVLLIKYLDRSKKRSALREAYKNHKNIGDIPNFEKYQTEHKKEFKLPESAVINAKGYLLKFGNVNAYASGEWTALLGEVDTVSFQNALNSYNQALMQYEIAMQIYQSTQPQKRNGDAFIIDRITGRRPSKPSKPSESDYVSYSQESDQCNNIVNIGWISMTDMGSVESTCNDPQRVFNKIEEILTVYKPIFDEWLTQSTEQRMAIVEQKNKSIVEPGFVKDIEKEKNTKNLNITEFKSKTIKIIEDEILPKVEKNLLNVAEEDISKRTSYSKSVSLCVNELFTHTVEIGIPFIMVSSDNNGKKRHSLHDHLAPDVIF